MIPGSDAGVADAVLDLGDEAVRQITGRDAPELRLVPGLAVAAAAHDEMQVERLGDAAEPDGVAAHPLVGRDVDERRPAGRPRHGRIDVAAHLVDRELDVGQDEVEREQVRREDPDEVDEHVLVREREPELVRRDRTPDRHDRRCHRLPRR